MVSFIEVYIFDVHGGQFYDVVSINVVMQYEIKGLGIERVPLEAAEGQLSLIKDNDLDNLLFS